MYYIYIVIIYIYIYLSLFNYIYIYCKYISICIFIFIYLNFYLKNRETKLQLLVWLQRFDSLHSVHNVPLPKGLHVCKHLGKQYCP